MSIIDIDDYIDLHLFSATSSDSFFDIFGFDAMAVVMRVKYFYYLDAVQCGGMEELCWRADDSGGGYCDGCSRQG